MRVSRVSAVLVFALVASSCSPAGSLSDGEARVVIERLWNQPDVGLLLGDVRFVAGNADSAKGTDSIKEWPLYVAFAEEGVLALTNVKDLTKQFGGWNDWFSLTQSGVRRTATVALSEKGKSRGAVRKAGTFDQLWITVGRTTVESIAANDEDLVGTDKYRVVLGTHSYTVPDEMSAAFESARGWDRVTERRFKVLLKFDAIDQEWKHVVADIGKRADDFRSNNVTQHLQALKSGTR